MLLDAPTPGLVTFTDTFAALPLRALAGTVAVNCVPLTNVVVSAVPFHITVEPCTKLEPLTVSVVSGEPIEIAFGDTDWMDGIELVVVVLLFEPPPPLPHDISSRQETNPKKNCSNRVIRMWSPIQRFSPEIILVSETQDSEIGSNFRNRNKPVCFRQGLLRSLGTLLLFCGPG